MDGETYWQRVRLIAKGLGSDGCTGVGEFYRDCCLEHDIHYRTGCRIDGTPISRAEADARFRECIQARSPWGKLSPMSWWRWAAVRLFGGKSWRG